MTTSRSAEELCYHGDCSDSGECVCLPCWRGPSCNQPGKASPHRLHRGLFIITLPVGRFRCMHDVQGQGVSERTAQEQSNPLTNCRLLMTTSKFLLRRLLLESCQLYQLCLFIFPLSCVYWHVFCLHERARTLTLSHFSIILNSWAGFMFLLVLYLLRAPRSHIA